MYITNKAECFQDDRGVSDEASGTEDNSVGCSYNGNLRCKTNDEGITDSEMDDILMLNENDIPGASLNGKAPNELNIAQLKR